MLRVFNCAVIVLGVFIAAAVAPRPAEASCQLVKATHSADTRAEALKESQALAVESANDLKHAKGWKTMSMSAHKVKGDPFWKMVRPDGVPSYAVLKPDVITARTYTTCFTGVVVPYVCTSGSAVCGN